MKGRPGLTLTETVVASFVMLSVFAITATLFHQALRYSGQVENQLRGNQLAQENLEAVRRWSSTYANWALLEATYAPQTISQSPYTIVITAAPVQLASPCQSFESAYPVGNRKLFQASAKLVQVEVQQRGSRFRLNTLISEPRRELASPPQLELTAVAGDPAATVAKDGTLTYQASLRDVNNLTIPDIQFRWYTHSIDGDGTVRPLNRSGDRADFCHQVRLPGMPIHYGYAPGTGPAGANPSRCSVSARALYFGQDIEGRSSVLRLQP